MELFARNMPFFKGNLHTHTTRSDGALPPDAVTALYRDAGYDFLALTDHRMVGCELYHDGGMLVLPGVELDYNLPTEVVHIVGVGLDKPVTLTHDPDQPAQSGIDFIREHGGLAFLAHPAWSLNTLQTMASLRDITAAEIFNSVSGAPLEPTRRDSSSLLDMAAANGAVFRLIAADDSHGYEGEQCGGFTMVQAAEATQPALLEALAAGRFYASQGPRFTQVSLTDGVCRVECSPVDTIMFYTNLPWAPNRCVSGSGLTEAAYTAQGADTFLRVEIVDAQGRRAWSSPIRI